MEEGEKKVSSSPKTAGLLTDCDQQPSKSVVPRFASFKPRQAAPNLACGNASASRNARSKTSENSDGGNTNVHQSRHRRHYQGKYRRNDRVKENCAEPGLAGQLHNHESPSRSGSHNVDEGSGSHFIEDRSCDDSNATYGTLHRYAVPKYREAGRYNVLGLPSHFKAALELQPGCRLITTERLFQDNRHGAKSLRMSLSKEPSLSRIVAQASADAELDARRSYLPLSADRSRKRRKLIDLRSSADERSEDLPPEAAQYYVDRFEEGQDSESLSTSSDSELEPSSTLTPANSVRERHVHLSRLTSEDPGNVEAWLALIQHQGSMLEEGADGPNRASTSSERRGLADVRLSLYQKALSKTKGHPLQDRLVLGMMTEGAKIWDTKKLAKKWRSTLQDHPNNPDLWVQYLTFHQTSFVTFTYTSCQALFKNCLATLAKAQVSADIDRTRIYVFLRMTTFMREAGFSEHAHALWQAILEYCFFEPNSDQASNELFSFEDFWESEVPRLGEEGARGWRFSQRGHTDPRNDASLIQSPRQNLFRTWKEQERQRTSASVLPAKTLDEVDEEDPYRVILFHDIQPFLYRPSGARTRQQLLEAFLIFCGLPPFGLGTPSHISILGDPFLNNFSLDSSSTTLDSWLTSTEKNSPYDFPLASFTTDTATLFATTGHWFNSWKGCKSFLSNESRSQWTRNSLRQLLTALPEQELLAEYVVAFELQLDSKEARKYTKSLLKQRPSIRLYNNFALLECSTGNIEAAEHVWSTALSMTSAFSKTTKQDTILIWRSWLWALLDQRDFSKALRLCVVISDKEIVLRDLAQRGDAQFEEHPTKILRARQQLSSLLDQNLSLNNPGLSIHYLDVLTILTYLTSDRTLASSLTHYKTTSAHPTIAQSPPTLCLMHQSRARLLHLHGTTSPSGYRPSDITTPLAESIRLFPTNTIFLSLYHFHNRRSILIDRIRDDLSIATASSCMPQSGAANPSISSPLGSIFPPLFQIYAELNRPTFAGSTSHSVRSAFENALLSDIDSTSPARYSAAVWKLYVLWEIHVALKQASRPIAQVKYSTQQPHPSRRETVPMEKPISTFHRAIRACPWAKELYMLAFGITELREAIQEQDLRAVYEMMEEKELRVHVEIQAIEKLLGAK
jgi:NRDE-2, necessary for RNA interference